MLKKINENLDYLLAITTKLKPYKKKIKHFIIKYGCFTLTTIILALVARTKQKVSNVVHYIVNKNVSKEKYTIEAEVKEWIKHSYKTCKRNRSFLEDMMDTGHLRVYPQDGIMNCEFESFIHYISNYKTTLLPDVSFLHILIDRKASSPLREEYKKQDPFSITTLAQKEHRDRLSIRNKLLTGKSGLFSNPFLKYKFINYYMEHDHKGLHRAKEYAMLFHDKYTLASIDELGFDNIDTGAYFVLYYKNHYIIFYALNGYQYDVVKPKHAVVNYHYLILDEESFYKTHFYKFLKNNDIEL